MPTRKMARFSAVALIGFACVLATEARAQQSPIPVTLPAPALTAPLSFTTGFLTVTAGADGLPVPHDVPCPSPATGTCSEYTYRFTSTGSNLSAVWLSISSDVAIYSASPAGTVFVMECIADRFPPVATGVNVCQQREVRFLPNAPTFNATLVVSRSAPRVATAFGLAGFSSAFGLIQGPGVPGGAFTPFTNSASQKLAGGKLDVLISYGANGLPNGGSCNPVQAPGISCFEGSPVGDLTVNGQVLRDFEIVTFGDNTSTCLKGNPTKCYCTAAPCP